VSEPRIAIKVAHNHFVTCFPMPTPKEDEVTFPQTLLHSRQWRNHIHRQSPIEPLGIGEYVRTKEDQS
jgi:hypothetical protein